jgi:hypothetical protein
VADARGRLGDLGRDRHAAVRLARVDSLAQAAQIADGPNGLDLPVTEQRQSRGVIPAVLESLEAMHQQVPARAIAHISDDAAH